MVTLTIDGKQVKVSKVATILEAAETVGIHIPVLCHAKKLLPYGACRVCLVEVEQMKGRLIPACTTPVTEGMVVTTGSAVIDKVRKTVLEFLLVNHVVDCPVCDKGGECDLQDLTYEYEVVGNRFKDEKFNLETDEQNPFIERNMNRCVLCGKCVRVCDEIVSYGSYSFINRGFDTKVATAYDRGLDCEFCGQCVSMCPVGALLPRPFKFKARPWQLKEVDTVCGYCGNGCTLTLGVLNNKVETIRFNDKIGVNDGNLCVRGRFGYSFINSDDRLQKPLVRKHGRLEPASWNEALEAMVAGFEKARGEKGLGILSGGRLTNEEYYFLGHLADKVLKTPHLDHNGGECYKGVSEGLAETLGIKASTGTFPQVEECDAILAIRSDLYETHPVFGMVVNQAVKRNNAKFSVISDKKGKFTKLAGTKTLLTKPGTEISILNAMAHVLLVEDLACTDGVEGVAALRAGLADYSPKAVATKTGVAAEIIEAAARDLAKGKSKAILLAYGLPYSAYSRELGIAAANLAILCGAFDGDNGGLYLCGEKANSQGAIDQNILPRAGGMSAQEMLTAAAGGELSALYVIGEDPLASYPDRNQVQAALEKVPFLVVQDLFLTDTAREADVILPAISFAEKEGTFTNAERRIQRLHSGVKSPGEARSDLAIFSMLAGRMGDPLSFTGPHAVFAEITATVPEYKGIDFNGIGPQGVVWGGERLAPARRKLVAVKGGEPLAARFQMITGSALYHSGTLSARAQGPLAAMPESYVEFAYEDAAELGIKDNETVSLKGNGEELRLKAKVGKRLQRGVVFVPYHFAGAGVNRIYHGEAAVAVEVSKLSV
ncbi:NADH-quinone oxidoreductase subunit G [Geoalkalibacter ferrihydriticus]|uniref:NADH dehydrogenase n=2 Tax=Geoalkalibacter ferrihydriticus TaxID=392333 RepID=A0A0C2HKN4_9BACT|nr:molybdopterin-dependent oxidoreductase [Geoalkalibacter ferrihydriticus]KIH77611.1 NADH dehydrogenase [Geoalkalibacter ferrihydriticus DSM 17813]SDL70159.1 NADH-quinone oxidoreductase subunit G [Geoalkalibacter ferrihydriticus]